MIRGFSSRQFKKELLSLDTSVLQKFFSSSVFIKNELTEGSPMTRRGIPGGMARGQHCSWVENFGGKNCGRDICSTAIRIEYLSQTKHTSMVQIFYHY